MLIHTPRLVIRPLTQAMAPAVWQNSLDDDNRRFVPDEVFETLAEAEETVSFLISAYEGDEGPFVYAVMKDGACIGYVQLCQVTEGWEIGYHIAAAHAGCGLATEALRAFLPFAMEKAHASCLFGVVLEENIASLRVLEKCGFRLVFQGEDLYQGKLRLIRRYVFDRQ